MSDNPATSDRGAIEPLPDLSDGPREPEQRRPVRPRYKQGGTCATHVAPTLVSRAAQIGPWVVARTSLLVQAAFSDAQAVTYRNVRAFMSVAAFLVVLGHESGFHLFVSRTIAPRLIAYSGVDIFFVISRFITSTAATNARHSR